MHHLGPSEVVGMPLPQGDSSRHQTHCKTSPLTHRFLSEWHAIPEARLNARTLGSRPYLQLYSHGTQYDVKGEVYTAGISHYVASLPGYALLTPPIPALQCNEQPTEMTAEALRIRARVDAVEQYIQDNLRSKASLAPFFPQSVFNSESVRWALANIYSRAFVLGACETSLIHLPRQYVCDRSHFAQPSSV